MTRISHAAQVHPAPLQQVDQPAGGGDEDVGPLRIEPVDLLLNVHAADHAQGVLVHVPGQLRAVRLDLHRQLPGRRQHQRPRSGRPAFGLVLARLLPEVGQDGDQEGGGLAGAGLRLAGDVVVGQAQGQHLALNRGAALIAQVVDRPHEGFRQGVLREAVQLLAVRAVGRFIRWIGHGRHSASALILSMAMLFTQPVNTRMAASSSLSGAKLGAMRMLSSFGSLP